MVRHSVSCSRGSLCTFYSPTLSYINYTEANLHLRLLTQRRALGMAFNAAPAYKMLSTAPLLTTLSGTLPKLWCKADWTVIDKPYSVSI
jgi:hypothetical protein